MLRHTSKRWDVDVKCENEMCREIWEIAFSDACLIASSHILTLYIVMLPQDKKNETVKRKWKGVHQSVQDSRAAKWWSWWRKAMPYLTFPSSVSEGFFLSPLQRQGGPADPGSERQQQSLLSLPLMHTQHPELQSTRCWGLWRGMAVSSHNTSAILWNWTHLLP